MKHQTLLIALIITIFQMPAGAQRDFSDSEITKLVLLGTGNPNPSPEQSGCALALVVNNTPYIVDFGPGLVRKSAALTPRYGGHLEGLETSRLRTAFLTHLHSDHTAGYPDLILTPWVMGRDEPMEVYGPVGTGSMTDHILKAYQEDIRYRVYGDEPANDRGWRVNWHEFEKEGEIYRDSNIVVEAFLSGCNWSACMALSRAATAVIWWQRSWKKSGSTQRPCTAIRTNSLAVSASVSQLPAR